MKIQILKKAGIIQITINAKTYIVEKQMYATHEVVYFKVFHNQVSYCLGVYIATDISFNRLQTHNVIQNVPNTLKLIEKYISYECEIGKKQLPDLTAFDGKSVHIGIFEFIQLPTLSYTTFNQQKHQFLTVENQQKLIAFLFKLIQTVHQLHSLQIYHLDLKPENILSDQQKFKIIDFGTAVIGSVKTKRKQHFDVLRSEVEVNYAFIPEQTKLFSSMELDLLNNCVRLDTYDAYSIGCVIFHLLSNSYLDGPLVPGSREFQYIRSNYGDLFADIITNLTHFDQQLRYNLKDCLQHPLFCNFNQSTKRSILNFNSWQLFNKYDPMLKKKLKRDLRKNQRSVSLIQRNCGEKRNFSNDTMFCNYVLKAMRKQVVKEFLNEKVEIYMMDFLRDCNNPFLTDFFINFRKYNLTFQLLQYRRIQQLQVIPVSKIVYIPNMNEECDYKRRSSSSLTQNAKLDQLMTPRFNIALTARSQCIFNDIVDLQTAVVKVDIVDEVSYITDSLNDASF